MYFLEHQRRPWKCTIWIVDITLFICEWTRMRICILYAIRANELKPNAFGIGKFRALTAAGWGYVSWLTCNGNIEILTRLRRTCWRLTRSWFDRLKSEMARRVLAALFAEMFVDSRNERPHSPAAPEEGRPWRDGTRPELRCQLESFGNGFFVVLYFQYANVTNCMRM